MSNSAAKAITQTASGRQGPDAVMEFLNAQIPPGSGAYSRDTLGALAECLVRGSVLSARDAALVLSKVPEQPGRYQALLKDAAALRVVLRKTLESIALKKEPSPVQLASLSAQLERWHSDLDLVMADGRLRWVSRSADAVGKAITRVVLEAMELLGSAEALSRIRMCQGRGCQRLFIDRTKNRSGRWCEMRSCGNRAKAKRYYARHRIAMDQKTGTSQADGVP